MTLEEIDALEDELTIRFRKPIKVGATTYDDVTLHEPTVGQLKEITAKQGVDSTITAIVITGGVPVAVPNQMKSRDFMRAKEFFDRFLESPDPKAARS